MKRLLTTFVVLLLFCACASGNGAAQQMDALEVYDTFLAELPGAQITRLSINTSDLIGIIRPSREEISLSVDEQTRVMTYRSYNPFIFWNIGTIDYYDGQNYYYKYKDDWFVDHSGRFRDRLRPDFLGIPASVLNRENIISSGVYSTAAGYNMEIVSENPDTKLVYTIKAKLDGNFYIKKIEVKAHFKDTPSRMAGYYSIQYREIGKQREVKPPKGLALSEIEYLKQYYEEQARQSVPANASEETDNIIDQ